MPSLPTWPTQVTLRENVGSLDAPTFPFNVTCVMHCFVIRWRCHDPLSSLPYPLGPNVNRWAALKTSTEPTFPVFVTCVGQVGRLGMPLAFSIFGRFFETIHDLLSEKPCPLGPNVNRWAVLGASREPTFSLNVTCVGQVGRLGMPLASFIFC